ncbi:DEAD/DEAH box helicase [Serratia liquefaciens]|uniref:DEAD/DEAH box helicase n=1 Tax=Serratia liquefaciens TaxID=614 RepID=UPI00165D0DD7|nr:ATP-binding domain-containing protein [Serratia liquefaciens]QNQ53414.1 ATP-binding domain-containing protein [Serratia liquefaciens]
MKINADKNKLQTNHEASNLLRHLQDLQTEGALQLDEAELYIDFPLYKDDEDHLVISQLMIVTRFYGVIIFYLSSCNDRNAPERLISEDANLEHIYSQIYSRLLKQRNLRKNKRELRISVESFIYAPYLENVIDLDIDSEIINSKASLLKSITELENFVDEDIYNETASTIEGGKGLIRLRNRETEGFHEKSKVRLVNQLESAIARFDTNQLGSCVNQITGIERIRGLAGSGKTIVLAMKVAITHLTNKQAKILYTFSTKALYQHVKRLITRFYRQFDDTDPDFEDSIHILHAWGGNNAPGVYYNACINNSASFINYSEAKRINPAQPFSYACSQLINNHSISAQYDYVFVDEAQDFDSNFLQLCLQLAEEEKMVFGLDVFQNIFQTSSPTAEQLLGKGRELSSDIFLNKCYRTPCATLVCAHAIGLGVYRNPVQVIKTAEHWENLGYEVDERHDNAFAEGEHISVYRTRETSPSLFDEDKNSLIITQHHENHIDECFWVARKIHEDIVTEGLNASDILIICADDRNFKNYYNILSKALSDFNIDVNNVNADKYNISDFSVDNKVTYSTIHKAKGNESYSVYIVGCEALYYNPNVKNRNLLFTAMTRSKGWLVMTGIGKDAVYLFDEIQNAKEAVPYIKFNHPSLEKIEQIEIDLKKVESPETYTELEKMLAEHGIEGVTSMIKELASKKVKNP